MRISALSAETTSSPALVGSLLLGADEMVTEMVRARIPHVRETGFGPCTAIGIVRRGYLVGGVVFHDYRKHDVQISASFDRVGWALPGTLRALCEYPFGQLKVKRVTAIVGKKNKKARKALDDIGFTLEGVVKRGLDGYEDAMILGLLRENCKWLKADENGIRQRRVTSSRSS